MKQATLKEVYQKALVNKPVLDSMLGSVAQSTGARPISNLKNPDTTVEKVDRKNEEDPKRNYKLVDVNDVARGRLVYNTPQDLLNGAQSLVQQAKQNGVKLGKITDYFTKPEGGYRGLHIDLKFPNGQTSEVQLHTQQSYANTLATHQMHEQYGDEVPPDAEVQKEALGNKIMAMSNQQAQQVAAPIEQQNAQPIAQGQAKALQVAQGRSIYNKGSSQVGGAQVMGVMR